MKDTELNSLSPDRHESLLRYAIRPMPDASGRNSALPPPIKRGLTTLAARW